MKICFDNNVLIWGVRKQATPGQEEFIPRALHLIETLDKQKHQIILPAPVVGEYLLGTPPEDHPKVLAVLSRRFQIVPYDARSALLAAELWQKWKKGPLDNAKWLDGVGRNELKVDCQIVATAIAHGASCIYSHDPHIGKIAEGRIDVLEVPYFVAQTTLQLETGGGNMRPSESPRD